MKLLNKRSLPALHKRNFINLATLCLLGCWSFSGSTAILDTEPQDQFSIENLFDQKDPLILFDKTEKSEAHLLALEGFKELENGNTSKGIELLTRAWTLDRNLIPAGVLIGLNYIDQQNYTEAMNIAKMLQKSSPNSPQGYTLEGIVHNFLGDHKKSQASYEKALSVKPGHPGPSHNLAIYAINDENYDKAKLLYQDVLNHYPNHIKTMLNLAELESRLGNQEAAADLLRQAAKLEPDAFELKLTKAKLKLIHGKPSEALKLLEKFDASLNEKEPILEIKGRAQLMMGDIDAAIMSLKKWSERYPKQVWSYFRLAEAYEQTKQIDQAIDAINAGLTVDANHIPSQFAKARLLAISGHLSNASELLEKLKTKNPKDGRGYISELQGVIALAKNQPSRAVEQFQKTLKLRETNYINTLLALALVLSDQESKGYTVLVDWLKKYPEDNMTRIALADLYLSNNHFQKALLHYQEALSQQPENTYLLNNTAWLLTKLEQFDQAMAYAQKAYNKAPNNADILDTLGLVYLGKKQTDKAITTFRRAIEHAGDNPQLQFHLALALVERKDTNEAKKILSQLLSSERSFRSKEQAQNLFDTLK